MSYEWHETTNRDGSITYTVKCDLAVGYDEFVNRSENPLVALGWSEEQERYVVRQGAVEYDEEEERFLYSDDDNSDGDDDATVTTSTAFPLSSKDVVARECWCARPFQLFSEEEINPPAYCPVDTNGDGVPFGKNDPNTCLVRAYRNPDGVLQRQGYAADCYAEQRLMVFARSAWPLCFFWLVMLLYVWCSTNYGKRCKGFIWRMFALASFKARKYCKREKRAEAEGVAVAVAPTANTNANANAAADNNNDDDGDEEAGTASLHLAIEDTPNTIEEEGSSSSSSSEAEEEENSMEVITRDFGSHENYRLLDCDLRYNAERTNNEYITWLWYSALHSEEQRYKRERRRLRRERRRNQRRRQREWRLRRQNSQRRRDNQAEQAAAEGQEEPASNDDNPVVVVEDDLSSLHSHENDNQSEAMREILVTRRLEAVYWWPPAGPDGRRWQHLIDLNNGLRQRRLRAAEAANSTISDHLETDENSEDFTYDPNRLFLRTKPFSIEECLSESAQHVYNNNNNSGDTENNDERTEEPNTNTSDVEEIPENLCSICLCEIEDGEIVGDLSCKHYFHKDCLKVWLVKSNLCPFCRRCNIASHKTKTTNLTRHRRLTASTLAAGDTEDATV